MEKGKGGSGGERRKRGEGKGGAGEARKREGEVEKGNVAVRLNS